MAGIRIVGHTGPTMERKGNVIHAGGLGNCKMIHRFATEFRARLCETKNKILRQAQDDSDEPMRRRKNIDRLAAKPPTYYINKAVTRSS